jgi:hypothetical protein
MANFEFVEMSKMTIVTVVIFSSEQMQTVMLSSFKTKFYNEQKLSLTIIYVHL